MNNAADSSRRNLARRVLLIAGLAGASGVLMGSFGAHGLDGFLTSRGLDTELVAKRVDQFDVGVRYHLIHAVALLGLAGLSIGSENLIRWVARLMTAGLLLFSGSLYLLVVTNTPWLGAITPLGGLSWIVGWTLLLFAARTPSHDSLNA